MQGSNLVDEVMIPVRAAINRHVKNSDAKTDIYNRAYEAVMASIAAIEKMKKHDELRQRITELEKEIERLQSELKAANDDADRLANELGYFLSENGEVFYDISPALTAHKARMIDATKMIRGGNGSHWEGCEDVHYDCKIVQLEAQLKAATDAAKELYACLKTVFDLVDLPLETEEYVGDVIKWNKQYGEGEE